MTENVQAALVAALAGDASALMSLDDAKEAHAAAERLGPLIITPLAVARVLEDFREGWVSAVQAQAWAFWVRHGVRPESDSFDYELDIDWDDQYGDAIAEATTRLEELGDLVDGSLRPGEADQLLDALRPPAH